MDWPFVGGRGASPGGQCVPRPGCRGSSRVSCIRCLHRGPGPGGMASDFHLLGHSLFHLVKTNQAGRCLTARYHAALGHTWPLGHFLTSPSPGHRLLSGQLAQGGTRVSKGLSQYV